MGYSTAIYAVDLDRLTAAVGSGDARLTRRLRPAGKAKPRSDPRVYQNRKGEIFFNGRPVSFDQLRVELRRRTWKGATLHYNEAPRIHSGRWKKTYSLIGAATKGIPDSQFDQWLMGSDGEAASEITAEDAAAELVDGLVTRPKEGHQYGLKRLCEVLGTFLTVIEGKGGMLQALKLNTPLSRARSPVRLPRAAGGFPAVGYLTAAEVEREVTRLAGMDLSYPKDEEVEADRKDLRAALRKAAKKGVGVVAFYH